MLRQGFARLLRHVASSGRTRLPSFVQAELSGGVCVGERLRISDSRPFATNSHDIFNVHRNSEDNNWNTEFDFTPENYERVADILAHYPTNYKQSAVIPLLDLAQQQNEGWLSLASMNRIAKILDMPEIRVYEVATFYTMFNRSKMGKLHVMVCGTTPCMLAGARDIYKALKTHLGVDYGETTKDGWFTLGEMECMGSCVTAPMIVVADYRNGVEGFSYNYYEDLTPEDAVRIVDELKAGKTPRVGSQHRQWAEPAGTANAGKWAVAGLEAVKTLSFPNSGGKPPGPYCRDLDGPDAQITPPPPPPGPPPKAPTGKA